MSSACWILVVAAVVIPLGLDRYMPVPEDNPLTPEKIALGRRLFFDVRLSRDGTVSCATCHRPERAFSDGRTLAIGVDGRLGHRHTPAIVNRGYGRAFFWDARSRSLEAQVLLPLANPSEMDLPAPQAAARVGLTTAELSSALSSYVRSILSANSAFDRFGNGDRTALTWEQQQGLAVFRRKGNCTACHVGPTMTDEDVHNTGIAWRAGAVLDDGAGRGAFKTPTLREIVRTAPYMHDGSLATLGEVVDFYDRGGTPNPYLDPEIRPLGLTPEEKRALVRFLGALTGELQEGNQVHIAALPQVGLAGTLRVGRN